jgi:hypothetical protein
VELVPVIVVSPVVNFFSVLISLEEAFKQVSEKDLPNWFTHCCYCTSSI